MELKALLEILMDAAHGRCPAQYRSNSLPNSTWQRFDPERHNVDTYTFEYRSEPTPREFWLRLSDSPSADNTVAGRAYYFERTVKGAIHVREVLNESREE